METVQECDVLMSQCLILTLETISKHNRMYYLTTERVQTEPQPCRKAFHYLRGITIENCTQRESVVNHGKTTHLFGIGSEGKKIH